MLQFTQLNQQTLALCKAAIEAHGGMIKAENTGKGAKFRFVLPL